jgi:glycosyltransferase involved in cell wall biosynthesis
VYCGVDFASFAASDAAADRESVRREFGIEPAERVLGHVGRFGAAKNHSFLSSIAARARRSEPRICVLCVGVGPLFEQVRAQFEHAGVRAIFTGRRTDIPRLLRAMDVFVFPSIHEGLPLAVVEAQAAGLPCVVSTEVTASWMSSPACCAGCLCRPARAPGRTRRSTLRASFPS